MASEIRTNTLKNRVGLGTISFTNTGPVVSGIVTSNGLDLNDDILIRLGVKDTNPGGELTIEHSSSNVNFIKSPSNRTLQIFGDGGVLMRGSGNQNIAHFLQSSVKLYQNQTLRLETTSTGVTVTGTLISDGLTLYDNKKILLGNNTDLEIFHNGTDNIIQSDTGDLQINSGNSAGNVEINVNNNVNNNTRETSAKFIKNGGVELYHNNLKKLETYGSGIIVYGPEGQDGLLNLYADEGDDNADKWRLQADTNGSFYLKNYASGSWETNIVAAGNGSVQLFHDNNLKLNTRTDGVKITGGTDISMDGNGVGQLFMLGNGYTGGIALDADAMHIYHNSSSRSLVLGTNETERLRISGTNGSVGIGTDELSSNATFYNALTVVGDNTSQASVVKIKRVKSAASNDVYTLQVDSSAHTSNLSSAGAMSVDVNSGRAFTINGLGKIGIGTNNPTAALDVRDASGSDPTFFVGHSEADVIGEAIRIGRVAPYQTIRYHSIKAEHSGGTTSNMLAFHLHNGSTATSQTEVMRLRGDGEVWFKDGKLKLGTTSGTDNYIYSTNAAGIIYQADENGHRFQTYSSGWKDRLIIKDDGKIGIGDFGNSALPQALSLKGDMYMQQGNVITWNNGDCDIGGISGYHFRIRTYNGSSMQERLRITSGGQIGMGQNGAGNVSARAVLELNAPFNDVSDNDGSAAYTMNNHDAILINYSGASYSSGTNVGSIAWTNGGRRRAAIMAEYQSTDGDIVALSFFTRGTDGAGDFYRSFIINRNGSAGLHGTLATSTSDDRLKKDKVEITNALDKVNSLSSFTHKWNDVAVRAGLEEDKEEIGLSAQEVQGLYPCLVDVNNVMKDPEDPDTDYLTVHYAKVVPLLVASIKELTAKNKALEARLDALESS